VNIRGVEVVLEACHMHQRKPILFSSSEVYGKGVTVPFSEDDDRVMGPSHKLRWSYALGKAVDECLAQAYWQQHRLPVVTVRCFNTCGPRQTGAYGMVIPSLITRALLGRPMLVYGDGQQTRCFSHVSDVVRGVLMLAAEPAAEGEVFNIGTQEEVSILDLAKRIKGMTGSDSPIQFVSYEQVYGHLFEDMRRRVPDLRKVERMVGYRPRATLDELLADTIEHIRGELKAAQPVAARA
jgi:UDP-glucose 4-epimerase